MSSRTIHVTRSKSPYHFKDPMYFRDMRAIQLTLELRINKSKLWVEIECLFSLYDAVEQFWIDNDIPC